MTDVNGDLEHRLEEHSVDYLPETWRNYSIVELAWWVHLFMKQAEHRTSVVKQGKDLYDAENYARMLLAKVLDRKAELLEGGDVEDNQE